ncbi:hypothetical protein AGR1A_Lc120001 [Agrobacterium fabacearum CFBP 5771]|nr:hypothetical protein AGR1A_Lc120001 [Agrobacterium fabacearum CFBP 5771]
MQISLRLALRMGEGTDFLRLIARIAGGVVYFDPAKKLDAASTESRYSNEEASSGSSKGHFPRRDDRNRRSGLVWRLLGPRPHVFFIPFDSDCLGQRVCLGVHHDADQPVDQRVGRSHLDASLGDPKAPQLAHANELTTFA